MDTQEAPTKRTRRPSRFIALAPVEVEVGGGITRETLYRIAAQGVGPVEVQAKLTEPGIYIIACIHRRIEARQAGLEFKPAKE